MRTGEAGEREARAAEVAEAFRACHQNSVLEMSPSDRRRQRVPDADWDAMCSAVARFTVEARDEGVFPEGVLVRLKDLLNDSVPGLSRDSPLRSAVLRCCLEAYFGRGST